MMEIRPIDGNALLTVPNVNWVYQYDETGEYIKYKAIPVEAIEKAPTLDHAPKWISVKDRLPDDDVRVLVCSNDGDESHAVAITHYTHRKYGYNIEGWIEPWQYFFYNHEITHWMPLPEPPKEG